VKAYLALLRIDLKLTLRRRTVLFFHYLLPLTTFFALSELLDAEENGLTSTIVSMVTVLGIVANGFFGAGMRAVQEREANILRRFKVAPIGPLPLLAASLASGLILFLPAAAAVLAIARLRYGMPLPDNLAALVVLMSAGVLAFRALGLVIASVAGSVQESQILVQLAYLPMVLLSGTTIPAAALPAWVHRLAAFLPSTYLLAGMQKILFRREGLAAIAAPLVALTITAALGTFLSAQLFRWEKEEPIRPAAKLWVLAALAPFFALGVWQVVAGGR
jgi:ABC-2 type transport system permease protein